MKLALVSIGPTRGQNKRGCENLLVAEYLKRTTRFVDVEGVWVETELAFWQAAGSGVGRPAKVILMDSRGSLLSSMEFAKAIGAMRDSGTPRIVLGIGGADGWKAESLERADLRVSMGSLTLPHALARVIAAEQVYRAMTILAGHPYHCGH